MGADYEVIDENIPRPHLNLYHCSNLREVSNLGYVRELNLSGCIRKGLQNRASYEARNRSFIKCT